MKLVFIAVGVRDGWSHGMMDAIRDAGVGRCHFLNDVKNDDDDRRAMMTFALDHDAVMIGFNGGLVVNPNPATGDMPPCTLANWFVDGPSWHFDKLSALHPSYVTVYCDDQSLDELAYLGLAHRALVMHHAGPPPAKRKKDGDRPFDICFVGNVPPEMDARAFQKSCGGWPKKMSAAAWRAAEIQRSRGVGTMRAWRDACADAGFDIDAPPPGGRAEALRKIEFAAQGQARRQLLANLPGDCKVVVAGDLPADLAVGAGVETLGPIPFERARALFRESKIVLNMTPKFPSGATERVWFGVAEGAVVASNPGALIAPFVEAGEMIALPPRQPETWGDILAAALADESALADMRRRASARYADGHLFEHRITGLLADLERVRRR